MTKLFELIRAEVVRRGVLPFARFMELALYCPEYGYYETKKDNPGRRGDFYTSVSVGNLFGELLAFQFAEWLETLAASHQPSTVSICEAGAHDGQLAKDVLDWLRIKKPQLFEQINYYILEPSPRRTEWQRENLKDFPNVRWISDFNAPTLQHFNGIIFSNELLDAFPIHRFGWDAKEKKWFEWGVAFDGEKFVWERLSNSLVPQNGEKAGVRGALVDSPFSILHLPSALLEALPDNYTIEISPAAEDWWRNAAGILQSGKLLTFDYGFTADEQFSPARTSGTLRAYFRHHHVDDILANVGEQDLTAHVNFSAIQKIGETAGLKTEIFYSQPKFLTQILEKTLKAKNFGEWNSARARQFQTLTHPEHLGRAFKVLIQSR
ncbi:MAG TPA: SAM-dependent methyltransferase [Verrucomicrobiae bacterium]|nr:SAM-dependent methyltransferase [Verrucomicrobiae bacterium]